MTVLCEVTETPLSVDRALGVTANPAHGAADLFLGYVRNRHDGRTVTGITYDAEPSLAKQALDDIAQETVVQYNPICIYIGHAVGVLPVGGLSVLIAVTTPHRAESFASCRDIIEHIKRRAPIWKREHYEDGKSAWLPGHSLR